MIMLRFMYGVVVNKISYCICTVEALFFVWLPICLGESTPPLVYDKLFLCCLTIGGITRSKVGVLTRMTHTIRFSYNTRCLYKYRLAHVTQADNLSEFRSSISERTTRWY